jgi:hypothetical protein
MTLTSDLQSQASKAFPLVTPGFAYTYVHHGVKGLRLEAPDIVQEYTDGVPLGRDPKGLLYFNTLRPDFDPNRPVKYKVSYPSRGDGVDKEIVIVIDFHPITTTKPFAKFIATLPQRAHKDAIPFEGGGDNGRWAPFEATQATTQGTKGSTEDDVVLKSVSLKKIFTFTVPNNVSAQNLSMDTLGYTILTDFDALKTGVTYFVDYTNTRILIFKAQGDEDPVAVFGSYELQRDFQLFDADFQVQNGRFTDI